MPVENAISSADAYAAEVAQAVANRMTTIGLRGEVLRERTHLDPFTKDECESRTGVRPLARTLRTPDFPGLGPVDVILDEPRALMEFKWAYQSPGKIFESLWDVIKLALLGSTHSYRALYVGTGASLDEWAASESADLFVPGELDPPNSGAARSYRRAARTTAERSVRTWLPEHEGIDRCASTAASRSGRWSLVKSPATTSCV